MKYKMMLSLGPGSLDLRKQPELANGVRTPREHFNSF